MSRHADGTNAWAASTVRNAERFVQIEMANVGTNRPRTRKTDLGIHVGTIHVDLSAVLVSELANLDDTLFKYTVRAWVGDHDGRHSAGVLLQLGAEVIK